MRLLLIATVLLLSLSGFAQKYYLFIGTYTNNGSKSKGIYVYRFDAATGEASPVSTLATDNPSYLALAPGGKFLYAVNETDGKVPGGVSAFSFDKTNGQLKFLDKQASGGDDPCYISVDSRRKWAFVANYNGGNLSALPIHADGSLGAMTQLIQRSGKGPNAQRQEKPHMHSVTLSPDEHYLLAADLGLDQVSVYRFNPGSPTHPLTAPKDSIVSVSPGSGPRHISFYPHKPYAYLMTEMGGAVDAFRFTNGHLTPLQHISSHPEGYKGDIGSADIHVAPGGKFLYASNRGDANSLAIYAIDTATGKLTVKGFESTGGKTPRNFMIDPTGHWLLVANQRTDNIVIFRIDPATGLLKATGKEISIPAPVCLKTGPMVP
jgi:6-phosphogluconolactonase